MPTSKLVDYLFKRVENSGVAYTFGIPGDFVLPVYAAQERSRLKTVVMTHEPSVGFAADAYARLRGLGVALVTYGAGGLNMINAVGLAYAEQSPLLVISGGPETSFRRQKPQLHHCVKTFETQYNVFAEVTAAQTILSNPESAQQEIDRVIDCVLKLSRPGYIELPRDLVNCRIETINVPASAIEGHCPAQSEAVNEILQKLRHCERPVLFAGAEISRFKLTDKVLLLAESLNIPVVTSILGKASFPENHPNFIGTYFGQFGSEGVREYVEQSDCIFCLGAVLTEMETGGYTARLEPEHLIAANAREVTVGYHSYSGLNLLALITELGEQAGSVSRRFTIPQIVQQEPHSGGKELTVQAMISNLNDILGDRHMVVCDVGDCLYAGLSLKTDVFIAPGYYSSMGFGVPAAIGAQLALPARRPVVLVGDGGFQMTGMEISTAVKMGLNPIVVVFNNASYAMLRYVDQERDYYKLPRWDYVAIARAVGGQGAQASTKAEFQAALQEAQMCKGLFLIDAVLAPGDISPTLKRVTDHFGQKVKAAIS